MSNNSLDLGNLLLGTATASTQVEGQCTNTNWYSWYQYGKIHDNSSPNKTDLHWEHWKEDCDLLASLGVKCARIGVEWGRIEPSEGVFDQQAILHYRTELQYLNKLNIKPMLTIWHFSNPLWFEEKGGFLNKDAKSIFLKYAEVVVKELGKEVESWITINEPNVYAMNSFFTAEWPPGEKSFFKMIKIINTFNRCHIDTYEMIHKYYPKALVGTSLHVRSFQSYDSKNIWYNFVTRLNKRLFQSALAVSMNTGKHCFPYSGYKTGKYYDFIGLNYYSRSTCKGFADGTLPNCPKNDLNWEIYPEGIGELAKEYYQKYQSPIYITENGTCDNTDSFRSKYIYDHLKVLVNCGVPVERYYHWSFMDNWEWLEGESARFGIVHVDYSTQKRTLKDSGKFYQEICLHNGVTKEIYDKYVEPQHYNVR